MMLERLLKYTAVADRKFIEVFENYSNYDERALLLISHILNAQNIWTSRILNTVPQFERFQPHSPDQLMGISEKNTINLRFIFDTQPLDREVYYSTSAGDPYVNTVEEILYHVVNHSTYHRGQVASLLRQAGIDPPVTDFVFLKRAGEL
jgi:uncharacterized damage-inducible protein DinB